MVCGKVSWLVHTNTYTVLHMQRNNSTSLRELRAQSATRQRTIDEAFAFTITNRHERNYLPHFL